MSNGWMRELALVGAVGAGIAGGVYFAFSTFVVTALRRLPRSQGIAAMNAINKAAPNPLFMLVLFGTAAVCLVLVLATLRRDGDMAAWPTVTGCGLYLVSLAVTVCYHVPRNHALMRLDPASAEAAELWSHLVTGWLAWNHVRAVCAVGGMVLILLAWRGGRG